MAVDILAKRLMFGKLWKMWRRIALVAIALLAFFLVTTSIGARGALGQMPPQLSAPGNSRAQSSVSPLEGIGNILRYPIELDGRELFKIAAYQANSIGKQKGDVPIKMRVRLIENNLYGIIDKGFDPETLQISPEIVENKTIIVAYDGKSLEKMSIFTITKLDAIIHGLPLDELAKEASKIIKAHLIRAKQQRQPEYLLRQGFISGGVILLAIALNFVLLKCHKQLAYKFGDETENQTISLAQEELANPGQLQSPESPTNADSSAAEGAEMVASRRPNYRLQERRNLNEVQKLLLQIGIVGICLGSIAWIAGRFPWTRWLQFWILAEPIALVGIFLGTSLAIRGSHFSIDRYLNRLQARQSSSTASQRNLARITTVLHIVKGFLSFILIFVAIILALETLEIPIGPILAGAGILGFAISFASQSFIKDIVNGCLIFWEDWYAVGDYIIVKDVAGTVEYVTLRFTQVRSLSGELNVIPNGEISIVSNFSKDWSSINFTIEVDYQTDIKLAMKTMKEVAEELHGDSEWQEHILEPVEMLVVNGIANSGIEIKIIIKTQPGRQLIVASEYRYRLKQAFDERGIGIGIPQQKLVGKSFLASK